MTWPKATDEEVNQIVTLISRRTGVAVTQEKRDVLHCELNDIVFNGYGMLLQRSQQLSPSEASEILTAVATSVRSALGVLQVRPPTPEEIVRSPGWELTGGLISNQMNPTILDLLELGQERPDLWFQSHIGDIATGMVQLVMLAERAKERAPAELKKKKAATKPEHWLAASLGNLFRATWGIEPTRSLGSPWTDRRRKEFDVGHKPCEAANPLKSLGKIRPSWTGPNSLGFGANRPERPPPSSNEGEVSMADQFTKLAFSIDEATQRTGLGRDKLYAAIRNGELEARKAGRRTLVTEEALRRYLANLPSLQLPPAA
jgi:excisionase family DNA binding protein